MPSYRGYRFPPEDNARSGDPHILSRRRDTNIRLGSASTRVRRANQEHPEDLSTRWHSSVAVLCLAAAFERDGEAGLVNKRPVARSPPRTTRPEVVEQVLHVRRTYHRGPQRIVWYLARYQGVSVSDATIYRMLRRHGGVVCPIAWAGAPCRPIAMPHRSLGITCRST